MLKLPEPLRNIKNTYCFCFFLPWLASITLEHLLEKSVDGWPSKGSPCDLQIGLTHFVMINWGMLSQFYGAAKRYKPMTHW
jgi:hypothetical protein